MLQPMQITWTLPNWFECWGTFEWVHVVVFSSCHVLYIMPWLFFSHGTSQIVFFFIWFVHLFAYAFCIPIQVQVNLGEYKLNMFFILAAFADIANGVLRPWVNYLDFCVLMLESSSSYIRYFSSRFCSKTFIPCYWKV